MAAMWVPNDRSYSLTEEAGTMDNTEDIIDSRAVIERLEHLAGRWQAVANGAKGVEPLDDDERAELESLTRLADEAEGYSEDWQYGATLIRDSYFEDYARELADDIGAVRNDNSWPTYCIDWEWAAEELQQDYTAVDFDGVTYWVR